MHILHYMNVLGYHRDIFCYYFDTVVMIIEVHHLVNTYLCT